MLRRILNYDSSAGEDLPPTESIASLELEHANLVNDENYGSCEESNRIKSSNLKRRSSRRSSIIKLNNLPQKMGETSLNSIEENSVLVPHNTNDEDHFWSSDPIKVVQKDVSEASILSGTSSEYKSTRLSSGRLAFRNFLSPAITKKESDHSYEDSLPILMSAESLNVSSCSSNLASFDDDSGINASNTTPSFDNSYLKSEFEDVQSSTNKTLGPAQRVIRSNTRPSCLFAPTASSMARSKNPSRDVNSDVEEGYSVGRNKRKPLESSTDIELKEMETARKQLNVMRTRNMAAAERFNREKGSHSGPVSTVYSSKPLTIAHSPKFSKSKKTVNFEKKDLILPRKSKAVIWNATLTEPKSPKLTTRTRANNYVKTLPLSIAEREEIEVQEQKKHQFKALPYSSEMASKHANISHPTRQSIAVTHSQPFKFATDKRLGKVPKLKPSVPRKAFKASRAPVKSVFRGPTKPRSPKLATKSRQYARPAVKSTEEIQLNEAKHQFRARKRPDYERLAASHMMQRAQTRSMTGLHLTDPEPFKLCTEKRGEVKAQRLMSKVLAEEEAAAAAKEVHALPMPRLPEGGYRIRRSARNLTETQDFHLTGTERHIIAEAKLAAKVVHEREVEDARTKFKSLPLPNTTFVPEKENKPPARPVTAPMDIYSRSEERAYQREIFETQVAERTKQAEAEAKAEKSKKAAREAAELQVLRSKPASEGGHMFVARPVTRSIPSSDHTAPKKPLTQPISPRFATTTRAAYRNKVRGDK